MKPWKSQGTPTKKGKRPVLNTFKNSEHSVIETLYI